ncbi:cysteine hydrolase family protein [Prosthecobacter fusiformis]|nr:isochorismatase family cysteine hydrolase [Prosthecobacter fusiformis]
MASAHNASLHGSAPDKAAQAVLLIDVINAMDFPGGSSLLRLALPVAKRIAALKKRARAAGVPVIYVNDNFGRWRSDFKSHVSHCLEAGVPGEPIVQQLLPDEEDYFILKPKHSGFYSTSLDILLEHLEVSTLILTGFAGNLCVLYTANDAYMRDYHLIVPRDCLASENRKANDHALAQMQTHLRADIRTSPRIHLVRSRTRAGKDTQDKDK